MNIREITEQNEEKILSPYACKSVCSAGRDVEEPQCDIRTVFQRDRDRIIHCKSFRRMKRKTQVFLAPEGDHYRTRLSHTLEVAQIARTIARALRMNEDLTEAIALGHDLGHTPFGHCGERVLDKLCDEGFSHNKQGVRVVEILENDGRGLNLTKEVRDGILNHSFHGNPATMEGKIVRYADKIAYINHDMDDAIRAGILSENMLPPEYCNVLGHSVKSRLNTLIHDLIESSYESPEIKLSADVEEAMFGLRRYMFEHLYKDSSAKTEEVKAELLLMKLYEYFMEHVDALPRDYFDRVWSSGDTWSRAVCDYISGMTDAYAIHVFEELYVPKSWKY